MKINILFFPGYFIRMIRSENPIDNEARLFAGIFKVRRRYSCGFPNGGWRGQMPGCPSRQMLSLPVVQFSIFLKHLFSWCIPNIP